MWSPEDDGKRTVTYDLSNGKDFAERVKGQELDAVVEQVRDGSTARLTVMVTPTEHQMCVVQLAGIKTPAFRKGIPNVEDQVEPFGEEAQQFFETRLIQRDVKVRIGGAPPQGNFVVGEVIHPRGDIAEALVSEGLARIVDWTLGMVQDPSKLRAAEAKAKERRVRLFKDFVPRVSKGEFTGTVLRVLNGESIIVETPDNKERKIWLSSVRIPRPENAGPMPKEPVGWAAEAKEFLRTRLIGRTVHVKLDYTKKPMEGQPGPAEDREAATVTLGSTNMAEALVARGLATAIRHRRDDEDRSSAYDVLLAAETKAKEALKGCHAGKEPPVTRWNDASESAAKAKQYLPFLQRARQVPAVVEFVGNAGRFRIMIPKESARITLVLGGIRAPRVARQGTSEKTEPFGKEAYDFVVRKCLQRDVMIEVEGADKVGGFIGTLLVPAADPKSGEPAMNIGVALLSEGLASGGCCTAHGPLFLP
jgi:staphylococcal nuclease domain-containing protein 1